MCCFVSNIFRVVVCDELFSDTTHFLKIYNRTMDPGEKLLAALKNEDLPEVDHLLNPKRPNKGDRIPRFDLAKSLAKARNAGLESCVVKWIDSTPNIDPETCQTLLRPAVVSGSIETVQALLNRGAYLNMSCSWGNSDLVVAIKHLENPDLMKMVTFLVEKGANIKRSSRDFSPLLIASLEKPDVVPYLAQKGADVNEVGDLLGNTPLTAALSYGEFRHSTRCRSIVEALLSAGADPNKSNDNGKTALHLAADTEIISLLIQAGADLEARDDRGQTPLLRAAYRGKTGVINVLKKYGADMVAVDNEGNSALHIMVDMSVYPQEEIVRLFEFQCNQANKHGLTPLMLAAQGCHTEAVRILLEIGADPNIVNCKSGQPHTALSIVLDKVERKCDNCDLACAEKLFTHNSYMTRLPRCCSHFFNMIVRDQRRLVQLMVTHGMAPLYENVHIISQINHFSFEILPLIVGKLSPLGLALMLKRLAIAQYLLENWFLTPADLVGSSGLLHLRRRLQIPRLAESLRFIDENMSQPMSLMKLSFVAVSAQLGGVA
ncbi:LOW QUALITY PROTEIN: ankyrin repeat protein [Plakobranchus ocellatus]|uniref:Ankyrin repeat protein n=1 Tax=Plakobranchus ocellatus TaxID=259542 RepID=A0AAV4D7C6_9GAST|nr:LOW QUALITY PROTEIN: ankyrin repeat protein [Plakobranchus ocellatus]